MNDDQSTESTAPVMPPTPDGKPKDDPSSAPESGEKPDAAEPTNEKE